MYQRNDFCAQKSITSLSCTFFLDTLYNYSYVYFMHDCIYCRWSSVHLLALPLQCGARSQAAAAEVDISTPRRGVAEASCRRSHSRSADPRTTTNHRRGLGDLTLFPVFQKCRPEAQWCLPALRARGYQR